MISRDGRLRAEVDAVRKTLLLLATCLLLAGRAAALDSLSGPGRRNALPSGGYLVWTFDKKPQLGMVIVKVQVFSKDKAKAAGCELTGAYGMPSMRYHDSGVQKFRLSKKGDYLLPMDLVMPGAWELVIRLRQDGKEIYAGKIDFSV